MNSATVGSSGVGDALDFRNGVQVAVVPAPLVAVQVVRLREAAVRDLSGVQFGEVGPAALFALEARLEEDLREVLALLADLRVRAATVEDVALAAVGLALLDGARAQVTGVLLARGGVGRGEVVVTHRRLPSQLPAPGCWRGREASPRAPRTSRGTPGAR